MTVVTGIVLYCIVWCVVFFLLNPLWQVSQHEAGDVVPGTPESAPVDAKIRKKAVITSVITALIVGLSYGAIEGGHVTLADLAFISPPGYK